VAYLWALISAAYDDDRANPQTIKNRIIYTGDYFPALKDVVLGGRLNMTRVLDVTRTKVTKTDGSQASGELIEMRSGDRQSVLDTVVFADGDSGVETSFLLQDLKRVIKNPTGNGYIVFATPPDSRGTLKYDGLTLRTRTGWLELDAAAGPDPEFVQFRDIQDYTSSL